MRQSEFKKMFPKVDVTNHYVNPLELFQQHYFKKDHVKGDPDTNNAAITTCCEKRLDFRSEVNSLFKVVERFVKVKCPYCGKNMYHNGGGGNAESMTMNFKCPDEKCDSIVWLTLPVEGFSAVSMKDTK
jgi:hypothetical protein